MSSLVSLRIIDKYRQRKVAEHMQNRTRPEFAARELTDRSLV